MNMYDGQVQFVIDLEKNFVKREMEKSRSHRPSDVLDYSRRILDNSGK